MTYTHGKALLDEFFARWAENRDRKIRGLPPEPMPKFGLNARQRTEAAGIKVY